MKPIREVAGQNLRWMQPCALRAEYELRAGNDIFGALRWEKTFGSRALGESADRAWIFERSGCLIPKITVSVRGTQTEVGVLEPGRKRGGTLQLSDGRRFEWLTTCARRSEWAFVNETAKPVVHFKRDFGVLKEVAEVRVEPGGVGGPDLSLLTLLGLYLIVLIAQDEGGAVAAALSAGM